MSCSKKVSDYKIEVSLKLSMSLKLHLQLSLRFASSLAEMVGCCGFVPALIHHCVLLCYMVPHYIISIVVIIEWVFWDWTDIRQGSILHTGNMYQFTSACNNLHAVQQNLQIVYDFKLWFL